MAVFKQWGTCQILLLFESQRWIRTICQSSFFITSSGGLHSWPQLHFSCIHPTHYFMLKERTLSRKEKQWAKCHSYIYTAYVRTWRISRLCLSSLSLHCRMTHAQNLRFTCRREHFSVQYKTSDTSLETYHGPVCNLYKCNMETQSLQCVYTDNGLKKRL